MHYLFIIVLHYHLFPKSLGEVLAHYSVQELHLTQSQGLWRYDKWGYPVQDSAPGAELAVWFQEHTRKYVSTLFSKHALDPVLIRTVQYIYKQVP